MEVGGGLVFLGERLACSLLVLWSLRVLWGWRIFLCPPRGLSILTVFPHLAGTGSFVEYLVQIVASFFTACEQNLAIFGTLAALGGSSGFLVFWGSSGDWTPRMGAGPGRGRLLALFLLRQLHEVYGSLQPQHYTLSLPAVALVPHQ